MAKSKKFDSLDIKEQKITLNQWLYYWLKNFKINLRPKTKLQYINTSKYFSSLGNILLVDITPFLVQETLNQLPKSMASSSKKKVYILLSGLAKKALAVGLISENFMTAVEPPKANTKAEIEIYTPTEIKKILNVAQKSSYLMERKIYPLILLAATTGMRLGEISGLFVEDVDFTNKRIYVKKSLQYIPSTGLIITPPKTPTSVRSITVPNSVLEVLKPICKKESPKTLVFRTSRGTGYNPSNIYRLWKSIIKKAKVPYKNFHVLRHTHATMLLGANIPILEVSKRLGHSQASHTLNLYGHAVPKADLGIADKVKEIYQL